MSNIGDTNIQCHFPSAEYNKNYLNEFEEAVKNKVGYSWIRLGDSEHNVLLHLSKHIPPSEVRKKICWAGTPGYCGATLPNPELKTRLISAVKNANLVGVFKGDPELYKAFDVNGLDPKNICYAYDSIALPMNKQFCELLVKYKCLLVGGGIHSFNAKDYSKYVKERLNVDMDYITEIQNYSHIESCMNKIEQKDFDICLISAGVNAKLICNEMKTRKPALYLDLGHWLDNSIHPNYKEYWLLERSQLSI